MLKSIWITEKPLSFSLPPMNNHYVRASKGFAGSLLFHGLILAMGFSLALQTSEPKIHKETSTFRWDISLTTSPLSEPVTSDTPSPVLSAAHREKVPSHSQNMDHSTLPALNKNSLPPLQENRMNHSPDYSVKAKTIEALFTNNSTEKHPINPTQNTPRSKTIDASSQPLGQEKTHTIPFTHGNEAILPPPVEKVVHRAEQVSQPSILEEPKVLQRPRLFRPHARHREIRPDYGWLIHDLRTKLEQLKYYPHMARLNKWEGKVVVQMKILDDGNLIEASVEESSGFEVLDQTALAIIRQASPLELGHPLLANNVILSVPLTFQLE